MAEEREIGFKLSTRRGLCLGHAPSICVGQFPSYFAQLQAHTVGRTHNMAHAATLYMRRRSDFTSKHAHILA